jgi:tetratricopeptide (TPR) repeat protein
VPGRFLFLLTLSVVACGLAAAPAFTQQPQHQHYEKGPGYMEPSPTGALAPRLQNLGSHTFPVTIRSEQGQLFINQGLNLSYGFNHAEAARAFAEAARLDPDCAMAYWGHALVLGPNINAPMEPADEPRAYELVQKAVSLKAKASPRERDYIDALATRYTGKPEDRKAADRAYAEAMRALTRKYLDDLDAATLYAEALMDLRPWNYWQRDGAPYPETTEIISTLEAVLARNPRHPGAAHLYIHATEATKNPEKAEAAADTLLTLMPGAGHMVHMPSHTYMRVGRYADAVKSNQRAALADEDYITQCRAQGLYPLGYYPHNVHFLWWAASMEGRSRVAIEAARKTATRVPLETMKQMEILHSFFVSQYFALARFGRWQEILEEPQPDVESPLVNTVWHYVRGLALVRQKRFAEAEVELKALAPVSRPQVEWPAEITGFAPNPTIAIVRIAPEVLAGELAAARGDFPKAVEHLTRAMFYEDALVYTEPADWPYPVRQHLGAVLLQAGRPDEAEAVYWQDLQRFRDNGWSLFGLWQALEAQGKSELAAQIEQRFRKAWASADVQLSASRF